MPRYEHAVFACQYDLSEGDESHLGDREWYAERLASMLAAAAAAGTRGRPARPAVLEIGAGTGRITRALLATVPPLRTGEAHLVALDVGLPMLTRLRAAAPAAAPLAADMTALPIRGERLAAVVSGYNVFGCLTEPDDLSACLAALTRALRPGGRLLFDVAIHHAEDHPPRPRRFDWASWSDASSGLEIRRRTTLHHDPVRRRLDITYEYRWRTRGGAESRRTVPFALNTWPLETYERALMGAGLRVTAHTERTFDGAAGRRRMWVFVEAARD